MKEIPLENYVLEHYPGDDVLWITFDHAGLPKHPVNGRLGWAAPELTRNGWEVLSVKARRPDWFLQPDLPAYFRGDAFRALLKGKRRVILYGLSMGGFGAMAFSTLIPGSVVLAISPQTTLDPVKVPWEKRFDYALGEDWTGPFGDIDALTPAHAEAYVIYSPRNKFDGPHVERLERFGPLTHLPLRGNAHVPGGMLKESGLLKKVACAVAEGPFSEEAFAGFRCYLEASAAYHFYVGWEAEDPDEREAALDRCLELASPKREQYYRQRIASLRMMTAARARDAAAAVASYKSLRRCGAWKENLNLKVTALRHLLRAGAQKAGQGLIAEIERRHPEGHPKLPELVERCVAMSGDGVAPAVSRDSVGTETSDAREAHA